jgi:ABC-type multidrug transport system fused ATPase/permease subunit
MSWVKNNDWLKTDRQTIEWNQIRLFLQYFKPYTGWLMLSFALGILSALIMAIIPKLFFSMQTSFNEKNTSSFMFALAGYGGLVIFQNLALFLGRLVRVNISTRLNQHLILKYYQKLLNVKLEEFTLFQQRTNLFQRVIDATSITGQFSDILLGGMQQVIIALIIGTIIYRISPLTLMVLILSTIVVSITVYFTAEVVRKRRAQVLAVNYPLVGKLLEVLNAISIIKILSGSLKVTSDVSQLIDKRKVAEQSETKADAMSQSIISLITTISSLSCVALAFSMVINGQMSIAEAFAIYVLTGWYLNPVSEAARSYQNLASVSVNIKNYNEVLQMSDERVEKSLSQIPLALRASDGSEKKIISPLIKEMPVMLDKVKAASVGVSDGSKLLTSNHPEAVSKTSQPVITFKNVNFAYHGGEQVIKNLSMEILKNEKVCLIGKSGGGKTTMLRLLLGLLNPQSGEIIVDSDNLSNIPDLISYRKKFGVVSQVDVLFEMSIRENMLFGLSSNVTDNEILEILDRVDLKNHILSTEKGLDNIYYENMFSGGQKQRFTIARALVRNPPFVIMDEPTSALDFENEERVLNAISGLTKSRTSITVAHRLSTIQSADRVLILEDGAISATGKHDYLYDNNVYYRALCDYNSFIV